MKLTTKWFFTRPNMNLTKLVGVHPTHMPQRMSDDPSRLGFAARAYLDPKFADQESPEWKIFWFYNQEWDNSPFLPCLTQNIRAIQVEGCGLSLSEVSFEDGSAQGLGRILLRLDSSASQIADTILDMWRVLVYEKPKGDLPQETGMSSAYAFTVDEYNNIVHWAKFTDVRPVFRRPGDNEELRAFEWDRVFLSDVSSLHDFNRLCEAWYSELVIPIVKWVPISDEHDTGGFMLRDIPGSVPRKNRINTK